MQLDDVIATTSPDHARIKEAMERSVRWLDRCIEEHKYPEKQNLFCIIQGGLDLELRKQCCEEMVARDTPGIAIGGLSGGEAKEEFCKVFVSSSPDCFQRANPTTEWIHAQDFCLKISLDTSWAWYVSITTVTLS
jgi:tRNA-guanine family transglycosylase